MCDGSGDCDDLVDCHFRIEWQGQHLPRRPFRYREVADAVAETDDFDWEPAEILVHADRFSPKRFQRRIHAAVDGLTQNDVPDKSSPQGSTEANDAEPRS